MRNMYYTPHNLLRGKGLDACRRKQKNEEKGRSPYSHSGMSPVAPSKSSV